VMWGIALIVIVVDCYMNKRNKKGIRRRK